MKKVRLNQLSHSKAHTFFNPNSVIFGSALTKSGIIIMQPADHRLKRLIVQKPYCRCDRRICLWRRLVSLLTYYIMPRVNLSPVKGQTGLHSCRRPWRKYATCSGPQVSRSPGCSFHCHILLSGGFLPAQWELERLWHSPVNSETDGKGQPGNQKTASRDRCSGGQRAVLGWVRGFCSSQAEPLGV